MASVLGKKSLENISMIDEVNTTRGKVLLALAENPQSTYVELARLVNMTKGTVWSCIDKLISHGGICDIHKLKGNFEYQLTLKKMHVKLSKATTKGYKAKKSNGKVGVKQSRNSYKMDLTPSGQCLGNMRNANGYGVGGIYCG